MSAIVVDYMPAWLQGGGTNRGKGGFRENAPNFLGELNRNERKDFIYLFIYFYMVEGPKKPETGLTF